MIIPAVTRIPLVQMQLLVGVRIRRAHLDLMWALAGTTGSLVLISDMVSTDTAPDLLRMPESNLAARQDELIRQNNFFTGVNPKVLSAEIARHDRVATGQSRLQSHAPWMWPLYERRAYMANALTVQCVI
jgi:hypothetical protein